MSGIRENHVPTKMKVHMTRLVESLEASHAGDRIRLGPQIVERLLRVARWEDQSPSIGNAWAIRAANGWDSRARLVDRVQRAVESAQ